MMSRRCGVQCYASCPASTVTIQPPAFALTIPGPSLYCPNQPMAIRQCNPCAKFGGRGLGGKVRLNITDGDAASEDLIEEVLADDEEYRRWPRGRRPGYWGPWSRRPWGYGPYGRGPWGYGPYGRGPWGYGPYGRGPWTENYLED